RSEVLKANPGLAAKDRCKNFRLELGDNWIGIGSNLLIHSSPVHLTPISTHYDTRSERISPHPRNSSPSSSPGPTRSSFRFDTRHCPIDSLPLMRPSNRNCTSSASPSYTPQSILSNARWNSE